MTTTYLETVDLSLLPVFGTPVNGTENMDDVHVYVIPSEMSDPINLQFEY